MVFYWSFMRAWKQLAQSAAAASIAQHIIVDSGALNKIKTFVFLAMSKRRRNIEIKLITYHIIYTIYRAPIRRCT